MKELIQQSWDELADMPSMEDGQIEEEEFLELCDRLGVNGEDLVEWIIGHVPDSMAHLMKRILSDRGVANMEPFDLAATAACNEYKQGFLHGCLYSRLRTEQIQREIEGEL